MTRGHNGTRAQRYVGTYTCTREYYATLKSAPDSSLTQANPIISQTWSIFSRPDVNYEFEYSLTGQ